MSVCGFLILSLSYLIIQASCCDDFDTKSVVYTSKESVLATKTLVIVEGEAKCKGLGSPNLYAELNGILQPVNRNMETDNFQVTFAFEHKYFPKGDYSVRFFNEDGAQAYRRALRSGESTSSLHAVFTVNLRHKGISFAPWIHSETVALLTISLITLSAFVTKNKSF